MGLISLLELFCQAALGLAEIGFSDGIGNTLGGVGVKGGVRGELWASLAGATKSLNGATIA